MGNLSFEQGSRREEKSLGGWLSLSKGPFKSRLARLLALPRFRSGVCERHRPSHRHCEARKRRSNPESLARLWIASRSLSSGGALRRPVGSQSRRKRHVSTNPVVEPLAAESF